MRRKQRTRQHVIAAQSVNYMERFIVDEGHTAQRVESDYGYDLVLTTFDEEGYPEPSRKPKRGAKTVRVRVPGGQSVGRKAVAAMRAGKQEVLDRLKGRIKLWRR